MALARFLLTERKDAFAVFDPGSLLLWLIFGPAAPILPAIWLAYTGKAPRWPWHLALIFWIKLVTFGQDALIGLASTGVQDPFPDASGNAKLVFADQGVQTQQVA